LTERATTPPGAPLALPRVPVRASIYIAPDGNVHFGALFEDLVAVADAVGAFAQRAHAEAPATPARAATAAQGAGAESGSASSASSDSAAAARPGKRGGSDGCT
jgi:hypothetical protein